MATCTVESGMLFWKKACGAESVGTCRQCGRVICGMHAGKLGDGTMLCVECVERNPASLSTVISAGVVGAADVSAEATPFATSPAVADQGSSDTWHGTDSGGSGGSSDSGSSDSGSSDSGGSSSGNQ